MLDMPSNKNLVILCVSYWTENSQGDVWTLKAVLDK